MIDLHHGWNASIKPVIIGFILSVVLTFAAYRIVMHTHLPVHTLHVAVFIMAIAQGLIQLIFFLHLGLESKPRWNLLTFFLTLIITVILVWGSAWIMKHLRYNESLKNKSVATTYSLAKERHESCS